MLSSILHLLKIKYMTVQVNVQKHICFGKANTCSHSSNYLPLTFIYMNIPVI